MSCSLCENKETNEYLITLINRLQEQLDLLEHKVYLLNLNKK